MQEVIPSTKFVLKEDIVIELKKKDCLVRKFDFPVWEIGYSDPDDSDNYYTLHPMLCYSLNEKINSNLPSSFYLSLKKDKIGESFDRIAS